MKWGMEVEDVEVVLEKIWDLHDSISDAIHAISRSHFHRSIKCSGKAPDEKRYPAAADDGPKSGYVFVKGFKLEPVEEEVAEARSLNAIRTALEDFEEQLEFFHTVQSQQRAERDAAIARLEQSRIILAMRLADHRGKRYRVIQEAMAFVGDVCEATPFVAPEELFHSQAGPNQNAHLEKRRNIIVDMLISSVSLAKHLLKLERVGGALGNASLFAFSMLALLGLQQLAGRSVFVLEGPPNKDRMFFEDRDVNDSYYPERTSDGNRTKHLDVLAARG